MGGNRHKGMDMLKFDIKYGPNISTKYHKGAQLFDIVTTWLKSHNRWKDTTEMLQFFDIITIWLNSHDPSKERDRR